MRKAEMKRIQPALYVLLLLAVVNEVDGHGTPIQVHATTSIDVSGGVSDTIGFASTIFFESSETGDPFGTLTLPNVGPVVIWQIPGYEINGLSETSSLSIEVISRPTNDTLPVQYRSLWYWNPTTGKVAPTSSPMYLLGTGQRFATIDPSSSPPPAFLMADPVGGTQAQGGQQGFHNHGLLSYALDNSPVASNGAYGFFARLVSDEYTASQPFLIVLNRGVDYEGMTEAALDINAAAFLPGDYNHNDRVDAADYVVWRNTLNSTTELTADGSQNGTVDAADFEWWQSSFGNVVAGSSAASAVVPEPSVLGILTLSLSVALTCTRRRHRS